MQHLKKIIAYIPTNKADLFSLPSNFIAYMYSPFEFCDGVGGGGGAFMFGIKNISSSKNLSYEIIFSVQEFKYCIENGCYKHLNKNQNTMSEVLINYIHRMSAIYSGKNIHDLRGTFIINYY